VKPTGTTTISIVLKGVVQYVVLALATTKPPVGTAATIGLTVIPEDVDFNLIFGPTPYEHPVTLTTTDSTNGPLSKSVLNSPADMSGITVKYNGAKVESITYSATATDLPAANVINAVLTPGATTKPEHRHLYVANQNPLTGVGFVSVFDPTDLTATPTTITGASLYNPSGVAVDTNGKLYVANFVNRVRVFGTAHGNAELPAITGHGQFEDVAVDESGKLYAANIAENSVSVFDTAHGNAALPAITGGGLDLPYGVAVDANGKLYVTNLNANNVSVFDTAHGNAAMPAITGGGLDAPYGVAVDARGKLYVTNFAANSVSVFDTAHGNAAMPPITGGALDYPDAAAVDASGKLYVTNVFVNSVSVFDTAHGNAAMPPITSGALDSPDAVAVH
jgi:YVTN family beta-propeller protein